VTARTSPAETSALTPGWAEFADATKPENQFVGPDPMMGRRSNGTAGMVVALATARLPRHEPLWPGMMRKLPNSTLPGCPANEGIPIHKHRFGASRSYTVLLRQAPPHRAALSGAGNG
jgi:hypothetical protein